MNPTKYVNPVAMTPAHPEISSLLRRGRNFSSVNRYLTTFDGVHRRSSRKRNRNGTVISTWFDVETKAPPRSYLPVRNCRAAKHIRIDRFLPVRFTRRNSNQGLDSNARIQSKRA